MASRWTEGDAAPSYTTAAAARADILRQVTATGTLSPVIQVDVGSQVSGRIKALHADYNTEVKAGEVIAEIDPQLFESAVAQARARLTSAYAEQKRTKAVAENAKLQYQRARDLAKSGAGARADEEAALANMRSAQASASGSAADITLAKAGLEQAQLNLEYTTIRSPIDGVVVSRSVDVGQTVAASMSAPTLFLIAGDLRHMELHTSVAEADVGQLKPGMDVQFSVDAFPDKTFPGQIKQVRYEATNVSNVVTYDAVVTVENPALELRPGMTANVSFVLQASRGVLAVPNKALAFRPADFVRPERETGEAHGPDRARRRGGADRSEMIARPRMLFVLRDGAPTPVRVTVGLSDGTSTEVTGGALQEGDAVITSDGSTPARPAAVNGPRGGRRGPPRVL